MLFFIVSIGMAFTLVACLSALSDFDFASNTFDPIYELISFSKSAASPY